MKRQLKWWIRERHNPQLGVYYVACGQMPKAQAASFERALYGDNYMHGFDSEADYRKRLAELAKAGERIQ